MNKRADYLASIVDTIRDYREGDISAPDADRVDTWVKQFAENVQLPILSEMDYVLKRTYFSRERVEKFLGGLIEARGLVGGDPRKFWSGVSLLNIQQGGNSQAEMRNLFNRLLKDKFGFSIAERDNASVFVYLDDFICTGNRVRNDLRAWINDHAPVKSTLHIIVAVSHRGGQWYAETGGKSAERLSLQDIATNAGKEIGIKWWHGILLEDRKSHSNVVDVLRPTTSILNDVTVQNHAVQNYVATMKHEPVLREPGSVGVNNLFSADEKKSLLEREFLIAGARIRQQCPNLPKTMRPLGHARLESLGFGSLVVTFRNCPNTAPLALWANPRDGSWYPLFPRVTNNRADRVVFFKTKDKFGSLSNMAGGFPLCVNGIDILTSEALYQACRFPHMPEIQQLIIEQRSPMAAKMKSKPHRNNSRPDWDRVQVDIMRWCLKVKLVQNWDKFSSLLEKTRDRKIVEQSRKDVFWGAKPVDNDMLVGMNVLGKLLMELREEIKNEKPWPSIEPLDIPDFRLYGKAITTVSAADKQQPQTELPVPDPG